MSSKEPPQWDDFNLSQFFKEAEYNCRITSLKYPTVFELLKDVESAYKDVYQAVQHDSRPQLLIPRFLIIRTYSSFLGAIRLAMSGQFPEAFPVLRQAIEQAWYALHIAKDPCFPSRMDIWLRRNKDAKARGRCKKEFSISNVRSTHGANDNNVETHLYSLYESIIDYGAHPNQLGVLTGIAQSEDDIKTDYQVSILHSKPLPILFSLRFAVEVVICTLKVFRIIFPERFEIMSIDHKINLLLVKLASAFSL